MCQSVIKSIFSQQEQVRRKKETFVSPCWTHVKHAAGRQSDCLVLRSGERMEREKSWKKSPSNGRGQGLTFVAGIILPIICIDRWPGRCLGTRPNPTVYLTLPPSNANYHHTLQTPPPQSLLVQWKESCNDVNMTAVSSYCGADVVGISVFLSRDVIPAVDFY